jgi:Zn-dependent protease with chaperone function
MIRRSPRRWWLYFWFTSLPILLFLIFIMPWYIDPLFHKFRPLQESHPQLVTAIERLLDRAGVPIPPQRLFLMEASAKTNQLNAYVNGIGASKQIVIWDTTINKTTQDETLFVVGHELGHYVLGHVWQGFLFFSAGLLLALYLGYRALFWTLDRWGKSWKVYGQADLAALAVLLLVLEVLSFAASPIENGFSRMQEHNADIYGLELIHGSIPNSERVAAHAFQVMGEIDLSDPNPSPFIRFWLYGHPPLAERLVFAHTYDPWSKGKPPKYIK